MILPTRQLAAASAVSLNRRNIQRSQQPSPSMGEGLGGGDGAAAKAPQSKDIRSQQAVFCFKEIFMLVPALTNGPDFRHSRVASGDPADITPTQPSPMMGPIMGEGFRMFGTVGV